MDANTVFRIAAAGLSGLVLFAAALALREPDVPEPVRVFPAVLPADPLAAELTRCRKLGLEAAGNQACEEAWAREPRPVLLAAQRVQGALIMGGSGVIDQFLNVFTTYIDSGFGLLGGDVRFLSQTLIALDITLAGLFWALAGEEDIIARLIKKTLYIGFFAFLIGNFNKLSKIIFDSFSGLGLKAAGSGLSAADFLHPGRIAQVGLDAGTPILTAAGQLMGYVSFFENFVQITVLMIAWAIVVISFFILAVQLFVTLIEFKLTTLAGLHPRSLRPLQQNLVPRRKSPRQCRRLGRKNPRPRRHHWHWHEFLFTVHPRFRRQPADDRGCALDRAGCTVASWPRHLWSRHRDRARLGSAAARRRRGDRHGARGGRTRRGGRDRRPCGRRRSRRRHIFAARGGAAMAGGAATAYGLAAASSGETGLSRVGAGMTGVAKAGIGAAAQSFRRSASDGPPDGRNACAAIRP